MRYRTVPRNPSRKADEAGNVTPFRAFFNAFMNVTKMLLQAENALAHCLKTKMTRLNNSGMNRTDRYLIDPVTFGGNKRIRTIGRGLILWCSRTWKILEQGVLVGPPCLMTHPAALIRVVGEVDAKHLLYVSFRPIGSRKREGLRGELSLTVGNSRSDKQMAILAGHCSQDVDLRWLVFSPDGTPTHVVFGRNLSGFSPEARLYCHGRGGALDSNVLSGGDTGVIK
jgi:hypothetical protein